MNIQSTTQFKVTDMDCPDCIEKVERAIRVVAGVSDVSASLMAQNVNITHTGTPRDALVQAIQTAGYTVVADMRTVFSVTDMECAGCAEKVERAICALDGIVDVTTSVMSQKVTVCYDPETVTPNAITHAIRQAGYTPDGGLVPTFWRNREKMCTLFAGLFFFVGLILSWQFGDTESQPIWMGHLAWYQVFYLLAAVLGGSNFFVAGFRSLRSFSLDIDFLMTVAILGAVLIGEHMEAAAIAFLFSTAELLEDYAIDRARQSLRSLMSLSPDEATLKIVGGERVVAVDVIERDQVVIVRPGEKVPVDGEVVDGLSAVDQSPITGESMPVNKGVGDGVFAGTINLEGYLEIRVTRLASESTLQRIIKMVEEAEENRAPSEQFVKKFSRYYTPVVTLLALGVILVPTLLLGGDLSLWFVRGLTLLVIACPCALVISTPIAVVSGITSAARQGVLIKGGNYLEAAGGVRVVAFDKTGTLTYGKPVVTDVVAVNGWTEADVLRIASALEMRSGHPIAQAICMYSPVDTDVVVTDFRSLTGKGLCGQVDGVVYLVGSPNLFSGDGKKWVEEFQMVGKTAVLVGTETEVMGVIAVADTVRPEAQAVVSALHKRGMKTVMLTGDNPKTAQAIAESVGVGSWQAELLPDQKLAALKDLLDQYGAVAMIGDGVNDAPALAFATVGIAMGAAGTDTALETADVALMADDLSKLPYLFDLSHQARRVIRQNIWFAILVKFGLAVGIVPGFVSLVVAVLVGDMGTTLGVTGNALRLARVRASV
ncbi:MAG: Cd2+/Zn2+-exporting ATPase [Candidatus Latescibacterota bacterium]|jgi:Cd2+/Zn2+-exporting ATPase